MTTSWMVEIPFPPTVNHYYVSRGRSRFLSSRAVHFRAAVQRIVLKQKLAGKFLIGNIKMSIEVSPPDKRTRDLDNLLKGPLDALAHAGVYTNDRQISDLRIYRGNVIKGGRLTVFIEAIEEEAK
jgi:crossover junction endodeoxyribonuclease RusA